jgi:hypothetical protein
LPWWQIAEWSAIVEAKLESLHRKMGIEYQTNILDTFEEQIIPKATNDKISLFDLFP